MDDTVASCIVQPEDVIQHIEASLGCRHQMKHLAELESMLFTGELEISTDEDKHTAAGARRLTIDGRDAVLALLERETGKLRHDALRALDLLTFEGQH